MIERFGIWYGRRRRFNIKSEILFNIYNKIPFKKKKVFKCKFNRLNKKVFAKKFLYYFKK